MTNLGKQLKTTLMGNKELTDGINWNGKLKDLRLDYYFVRHVK